MLLWVMPALLLATAQAQDAPRLTAEFAGSKTLAVQNKVDELFENGEFERAYFIYRNELVPVGDKYAQYMVGYMHLIGLGVIEDEVRASAWYRLAAERDYPEFVAVRNQVIDALDDEERRASDEAYIELRKQYSDVVLIMALLRKDIFAGRKRVTGSRLSSGGPVMVVNPAGVGVSGDHYFGQIETRIQMRLDYVTAKLGIERISTKIDSKQFYELRAKVDDYLSTVNDR